MANKPMTMEQFKKLATRPERKRRKSRDEIRAKMVAIPPMPKISDEEKARQKSLFERHDAVEVMIRLPLPPTVNHYQPHMLRRGKIIRYLSPEGQAFKEAVHAAWLSYWNGWPPEPITGRLRLLVSVAYPTAAAIDLDNRLKPLQDALTACGAYVDDSQIDDVRARRGPISREGGYVDVILESIPDA